LLKPPPADYYGKKYFSRLGNVGAKIAYSDDFILLKQKECEN